MVLNEIAHFSLVLGMNQRARRAWAGSVGEQALRSGSSQVSLEALGSTPGQAAACSFCEGSGHTLPMTGIHSACSVTKSLTTHTVFGTETITTRGNCLPAGGHDKECARGR